MTHSVVSPVGRLLLTAAVGLLCVAPADAQGLGDLAKAEAARRAAIKNPSQAIKDKDLKPVPPPVVAPAPGTPEAPATAPAPTVAENAGTKPEVAPEAGAENVIVEKAREKRDEKYWRQRFAETRDAVNRAKQDAADVQARIAAIDAQLLDVKLPTARRNELTAERNVATLALKTFKQQATDFSGELAALEQRARDMKVDPAWTR